MNNDIKEILEYLKNENNYDEFDCSGQAYIELEQEETKLLLDYITNLQKKIDFMTDRNDKKQDRIDKAIEYINSDKHLEGWINIEHYGEREQDLLNILQGSDEK